LEANLSNFVVGLDLGQAVDYTALTVLEKLPQFTVEPQERREGNMTYTGMAKVEKPAHFHVRHLERYQLGTLYPAIVDKVKGILQTPELQGAKLVVDGTGVGRPVVDMFRAAKLNPVAVLITGGDTVNHEGGYWRVPKRDLVGAVQVPLQDARLKFAEGLPLVPILIEEMLNFKVKITEAANDTYGAWREGQHDDLILSVMLAAWWAQRPVPKNNIPASSGKTVWGRLPRWQSQR
jgi:hypothetical protein